MSRALADKITDMEPDLRNLMGLARAVLLLGDRDRSQTIDASAVFAVGVALEGAAEEVMDAWKEVFKLAHSAKEGAR